MAKIETPAQRKSSIEQSIYSLKALCKMMGWTDADRARLAEMEAEVDAILAGSWVPAPAPAPRPTNRRSGYSNMYSDSRRAGFDLSREMDRADSAY